MTLFVCHCVKASQLFLASPPHFLPKVFSKDAD